MARLPQPGGDSGKWGDVLNDYLSQSHKADGTLKDNAVTSNVLAPNSVSNSAIASDAVNASSIADGSITEMLLDSGILAKLNAGGDWTTLSNKPAVIAAGVDAASARGAIGAASVAAVGGRSNTSTVAASNSSVRAKASADYVCTGTNDHSTINAAISALTRGGVVKLLAGDYACPGAVVIDTDNVMLEGEGGFSTSINYVHGSSRAAGIIIGSSHVVAHSGIRNLAVNAGDYNTGSPTMVSMSGHGIVQASTNGVLENVIVQYAGGDGIHCGLDLLTSTIAGAHTLSGVGQTIAVSNTLGAVAAGGSFYAQTSTGSIVVTYTSADDTHFYGCTGTGTLTDGQSFATIQLFDLTTYNTYVGAQGDGFYCDWNYSSCEFIACRAIGANTPNTRPADVQTNVGFRVYGTVMKFVLCHAYWFGIGLQVGAIDVFTAGDIQWIGGELETNTTNGLLVHANQSPVSLIGTNFYGNGLPSNSNSACDVNISFAQNVHLTQCFFSDANEANLGKQVYVEGSSFVFLTGCRLSYPFIGQNIFVNGTADPGAVSEMFIRQCHTIGTFDQATSGAESIRIAGNVTNVEISEHIADVAIQEVTSAGFTPDYTRVHDCNMITGYNPAITLIGEHSHAYNNQGVEGAASAELMTTDMPDSVVTLPRHTSASPITLASEQMILSYFTADKSLTVSALGPVVQDTAAGATPTLIRMGIYSVAASGDLTLIGSTPNDATLLSTAWTTYEKLLSAATPLVLGSRYAFGLLVISSAAMPDVAGMYSIEPDHPPRICGAVTGLSDLPSSVSAGTVNWAGTPLYIRAAS